MSTDCNIPPALPESWFKWLCFQNGACVEVHLTAWSWWTTWKWLQFIILSCPAGVILILRGGNRIAPLAYTDFADVKIMHSEVWRPYLRIYAPVVRVLDAIFSLGAWVIPIGRVMELKMVCKDIFFCVWGWAMETINTVQVSPHCGWVDTQQI